MNDRFLMRARNLLAHRFQQADLPGRVIKGPRVIALRSLNFSPTLAWMHLQNCSISTPAFQRRMRA
ncbi:MAG TPA: hypothetical protein VKB04_06470, partial [Anaerolineales bacterium]|nr:hypothetical protein [Anaerolineales bacterium]